MTIDQRARSAADSVRGELDSIAVPEPTAVVRRAQHRRSASVSVTALVVVVAAAAIFVAVDRDSAPKVKVSEAPPAASSAPVTGTWSTVLTSASGLGAGVSLHALATDGSTLLLGGDRPGGAGYVVTTWWSTDGAHWSESEHPTAHDSVSAIGTHDGTALAIGAPGGPNAFVWKSNDGGRHWQEIAHGPVFGASVPNTRPGAIVSGVLWHAGWWIAYGGAADGYEGIWVSRDGVEWKLSHDAHTSGSIEGIAVLLDGSLAAFSVGTTAGSSTVEVGWFTDDPTEWGEAVPIQTPEGYFLASVNEDATLAIGSELARHGRPTPVLRSADGGRTWTSDAAFSKEFSNAWGWTATTTGTTTSRVDVVAGTNTAEDADLPRVWLSSGAGPWSVGPTNPAAPTMAPTLTPTSTSQLPPQGALSLVAALDNRIVVMGTARGPYAYYVFDGA
jgi:hypothetical protein